MSDLAQRCAAAVLVFLAASAAFGQVPDLVTDRPDQTESAEVAPKGSIQVETGWLFSELEENGVRTTTQEAPGTLVRIGLWQAFELRLGWSGWISEEIKAGGATQDNDGIGDAEVGFKYKFADERGRRPQMAILVGISTPVGDNAFSSNRFDPAFRLSLAHTLTDRIGLGYNVGVAWATEDLSGPGRTTSSNAIYTVATGFGLTERLGAFTEVFGEFPLDSGGSSTHAADAGITFLVTPTVQLDLAAGLEVSGSANPFFVGLGISFRLDRSY